MVPAASVFERPCTRAFAAKMKRKERGTDSTESPDELQHLRRVSFDCFDARTSFSDTAFGCSKVPQTGVKAEEFEFQPHSPKRLCRSGAPSPASPSVSPRTTPRVRAGSSNWKSEALQADAERLPFKPDVSGSRLQQPLTPDYYMLFDLDPKTPNAALWDYFHWISDKASTAIESITTKRQPLTETECRDLEITVLQTPSEQLHYCNILLAQANQASSHLLWYRKRYDDTYRLVRAENEEYAYAFWNATGNKVFFRTICERIECNLVGEEMAHREPLKWRPINQHRLRFPDKEEETERGQGYKNMAKVDQSREVVVTRAT